VIPPFLIRLAGSEVSSGIDAWRTAQSIYLDPRVISQCQFSRRRVVLLSLKDGIFSERAPCLFDLDIHTNIFERQNTERQIFQQMLELTCLAGIPGSYNKYW